MPEVVLKAVFYSSPACMCTRLYAQVQFSKYVCIVELFGCSRDKLERVWIFY